MRDPVVSEWLDAFLLVLKQKNASPVRYPAGDTFLRVKQ